MAIAFVNSGVLADTGGTNITTASTSAFSATAGNLIVVAVRQALPDFTHALPDSVTDTAGNQYRRITAADSSTTATNLLTIWYAYNITGNASNVVTAKWGPNGVTFVCLIARQYSGLSTTADPFDNVTTKTATGVTTVTSPTFSTDNPNEVIVVFASIQTNFQTFSVGTIGGVTATNLVADAAGGSQVCASEDLIVSSTQTNITASINWNVSDSIEMSVVTFSDVPNSNLRFDYAQSKNASNGTSAGTISVTANSTPTQGDLVVIGVVGGNASVLQKVQDSNGNLYTITPNSPSNAQSSTAGNAWLAWLVAPSNAHATITATFVGNSTVQAIYVAEFVPVGGTVSFDMDIAGSGSTGTAINTPTVTAAGVGELLVVLETPQNNIASASLSPWTMLGPGVDTAFGFAVEFITSSAAGGTATKFTQSASGTWDTMGAAWKIAASFVDTIVEVLQFRLS